MNFIIDNILKEIKNTDLPVRDTPRYFPKALKNHQDFLSWDTVNVCLNNPLFEFEIIGSNGLKLEIPKVLVPWIKTPVNDKEFISQKISEGHGFIILNYGLYNKNTQRLLSEIEQTFNVQCDIHVYAGLANLSKSFEVHEDFTANFIIQVEGKTRWKVSNDRGLSLISVFNNSQYKPSLDNIKFDLDIVLEPGDMLYIPQRCYHVAMPDSKRLSMSVACWPVDSNIPRKFLEIHS